MPSLVPTRKQWAPSLRSEQHRTTLSNTINESPLFNEVGKRSAYQKQSFESTWTILNLKFRRWRRKKFSAVKNGLAVLVRPSKAALSQAVIALLRARSTRQPYPHAFHSNSILVKIKKS